MPFFAAVVIRTRGLAYTRTVSADAQLTSPTPLPRAVDLATLIASVLAGRERIVLDRPGRPAAVLLPLYDRGDRPHIILTKRTSTLPAHPGQVSLPGGQQDPEDRDLRMTALRETQEELGIDPAAIEIIGELDDVATFQSQFIVTPVVGVMRTAPATHPNPAEIDRVIEVPVANILALDAALPSDPTLRDLRYPLDGEDVWGATARILRSFAEVARVAIAHAGE
jgi:8-oxo-dGTP pyrophosphatase MutT (NUDIX family)